jgi:hypothetical protein
MLRAAYDVGYGVFLDLLDSDRWLTLENLQPKRDPVHATFRGCAFWINYYKGNRTLQACALFKDPEKATRIARALAKLGVEARMRPWKTGYYTLELSGRSVLKLAELCPEWRRALGGLAQNVTCSRKHQCSAGYSSSRKTRPSHRTRKAKVRALRALMTTEKRTLFTTIF